MLFGSEVSDLYLQPHIGARHRAPEAAAQGPGRTRRGRSRVPRRAHDRLGRGAKPTAGGSRGALLGGVRRPGAHVEADVARRYARARAARLRWAMGITQHAHGVDNVQAIVNLALARGMVGRPGAGLLPIRGHRNVQGVGSVGVSPALKAEFARRLERALRHRRCRQRRACTRSARVEAAARGRDRRRAAARRQPVRRDARSRLGRAPRCSASARPSTSPPSSTRATSTAAAATCLILPALARDEERAVHDAGEHVQLRAPLGRRAPRRRPTRCARRSRSSPRSRARAAAGAGRLRRAHAITPRSARAIAASCPATRRSPTIDATRTRVPDRRPDARTRRASHTATGKARASRSTPLPAVRARAPASSA